jgi:hypothetical protein
MFLWEENGEEQGYNPQLQSMGELMEDSPQVRSRRR